MLRQYEHMVGRYRFRFINQRMETLGLSGPMAFYLLEIDKNSPIKMNQLIESTPYHKSHATRMIFKLNEMDWVEKTVDSTDQRGFVLSITEAGRTIAVEAKKALADWDQLVDGALSKEEYEIMTELTKKTYLYLKDYFGEETK